MKNMNDFSSTELLATACRQTGLEDFGPDDFREGLEWLVEDLNAENNLPEAIRPVVREYLLRILKNRLWFARDLTQHPEIYDEPLLPPVIIISMPRVGSTKLQRLLSATPSFNNLLFWQGHMLSRIPGEPEGGNARRFKESDEFATWMSERSPQSLITHPIMADTAEEEMILTEYTFRGVYLPGRFDCPRFSQWLAQADMQPAYDYLKLQYQYMQWQHYRGLERPWLLKSPIHLGAEDNLAHIFPDGMKMICPHRHPLSIMRSVSAAHESMMQVFYGDTLPKDFHGEAMMAIFKLGMDRHLAWRERNPNTEVLDLGFRDICDRPVAIAEQIYDFAGIEFDASIADTVAAWDRDNPRAKYGRIEYSTEKFGLTESQIKEAFSDYIDRFADYVQ